MPAAGLCLDCVHVRFLKTKSGAPIVRCENPDLPAYPVLPVVACDGHQAARG